MKIKSWGSFQLWLSAGLSIAFGWRGDKLEAVMLFCTCIIVAAIDRRSGDNGG